MFDSVEVSRSTEILKNLIILLYIVLAEVAAKDRGGSNVTKTRVAQSTAGNLAANRRLDTPKPAARISMSAIYYFNSMQYRRFHQE